MAVGVLHCLLACLILPLLAAPALGKHITTRFLRRFSSLSKLKERIRSDLERLKNRLREK